MFLSVARLAGLVLLLGLFMASSLKSVAGQLPQRLQPREQCGGNCDEYAHQNDIDRFLQANCCRLIPCHRNYGAAEYQNFKDDVCGCDE